MPQRARPFRGRIEREPIGLLEAAPWSRSRCAVAALVPLGIVCCEGQGFAGEPERAPTAQVCSGAGASPTRCVDIVLSAEGTLRVVRGGLCAHGALEPGEPCLIMLLRHGAAAAPGRAPPTAASSNASAGSLAANEVEGDPVDAAGESHLQPVTIERIQLMLAALGLRPGVADGVLGAETREALRAYQLRKGLPATGHASEDLISALDADFLHCAVWSPLARTEGTETRRRPDECPADGVQISRP